MNYSKRRNTRQHTGLAALLACVSATQSAHAIDLLNALPASLDQPRINAYFSRTANGAPIVASGVGLDSFNVQAFFDTGASGLLLSNETADLLGIVRDSSNDQLIVTSDVGVVGSSNFNVSEPLYLSLAPYTQSVDVDNLATYQSVYNTRIRSNGGANAGGPIRSKIGPVGNIDPILQNLDVIGMPAMRGQRVVMDNRALNSTFLSTIDTYVYTPNQPTVHGPGVPVTSHSIKLSYANFDRYSVVTPVGAPGGTTWDNPFIGPNPNRPVGMVDTTPAARLSLGNLSSESSLLLDTGAAASILSEARAADLGVTYDPATVNTDNPILLGVPLDSQFQLTIGGIGGTKKIAGFFADKMLIRTEQGNASDNNDPNHFNYIGAPFLILDISLTDPITQVPFTLDGILGMNFLTASAFIEESNVPGQLPGFLAFAAGSFDFVVFDDVEGKLKVNYTPPMPGLSWLGDISRNNTGDWEVGGISTNWVGASLTNYTQGFEARFTDSAVSFRVNIQDIVTPSHTDFNLTDSETAYTLRGPGHIGGTGSFALRGAGRVRIESQNTYTGSTTVEGGILIFAAPQNIGPVLVAQAGTLLMETSQRFGGLRIDGIAQTTSGNRQIIITPTLVVGPQGRFDIGNDGVVIDFDPAEPTDQNALRLSLLLGLGPSTGIVSSVSLSDTRQGVGYALVSNVANPSLFFGSGFDSTSVLIRATLLGDTNLDAAVDFNDLVNLARSFNEPGFWNAGDSNYDGIVNFTDLVIIARNFNLSLLPGGGGVLSINGGGADFPAEWARALTTIPEPASLGLIAMVGSLMMRRRAR